MCDFRVRKITKTSCIVTLLRICIICIVQMYMHVYTHTAHKQITGNSADFDIVWQRILFQTEHGLGELQKRLVEVF